MSINKIAVVGAGTMGADIAIDLACNRFPVILKDINDSTLIKAKEKIESDFRMIKMMRRDLGDITLEQAIELIEFTTEYSNFGDIDLIIENVNEDWYIKKQVYKELNNVCKPIAYFGVNTSCISITKIASLLDHPENVIGVHFMNPVPLKKMIETIKGYHTSKETEEAVISFLKGIGKNPVIVNDFPGFVANRLSHLFMNEAAFLVQDQVAEPAEIDTIFKEGYGHKMGPLETADLIGLDTVVNSLEVLYESYQDSKFRCCPLLKRMVDAGLLGRKSGKGFYDY